jgi:hypothetical protein
MPCAMHTAQPPEALDHALIVTSKRTDTPGGLLPLVIGPVKSPSPSHGRYRYSADAMDTPTIPIYLHTAAFLC